MRVKTKLFLQWKLVAVICGAGVLAVLGFSDGAFATDNVSTSASAAVTVNTSCQLSSTENIPHTATVAGGVYRSDIGKTTIKAACNDANGYAIYAIGYTNNEMGRNTMLGTNTGRTIATGTATTGDASNWAMKLTAVAGDYQPTIASDTSGSFAGYHAVPSDYTKVASLPSSTDDGAIGSKMETTYAIYITEAQQSDVYNGKVKYTLVHPSTTPDTPCTGEYLIAYNANGGSGSMDSQTACVDRSIGLLDSGFTAPSTDYKIAGWDTKADGTGTFYTVGQSVANLASAGETATLYAVWGPKYIQDLTASTCSKIASGMAATVYDRRDGSDYKVRYIEGACWMVQNLRITGVVNAEYSNFDRVVNFDVCEGDVATGNDYSQARCHDSGDTEKGVWYNYAAASAGQITGTSSETDATQDICPAGWNIPYYDTNSGAGSAQSVKGFVAMFDPVAGGRYYSGSLGNTYGGFWWTAKSYSFKDRYVLEYDKNEVKLTTYNYNRGDGRYVRCTRTS